MDPQAVDKEVEEYLDEDLEDPLEVSLEMMVESLTVPPDQIARRRAQTRAKDTPEMRAVILDGAIQEVEQRMEQLAAGDEDVDKWDLGGEALLVELMTEDPAQQDVARRIREACRDALREQDDAPTQQVAHLRIRGDQAAA